LPHFRVNVAVQLLSVVMVKNVAVSVPLQSPPHPAKIEFVSGLALRVTNVPLGSR